MVTIDTGDRKLSASLDKIKIYRTRDETSGISTRNDVEAKLPPKEVDDEIRRRADKLDFIVATMIDPTEGSTTMQQNTENILADLDHLFGLDPGNRAYEEAIEPNELVVKIIERNDP